MLLDEANAVLITSVAATYKVEHLLQPCLCLWFLLGSLGGFVRSPLLAEERRYENGELILVVFVGHIRPPLTIYHTHLFGCVQVLADVAGL